ncbi:Endonuclease V [Gossypium arboreum]|uniref:Endonuclease V n=1 Tax=Gossypium arboreum TaxID=29729 RepID=A0A0B0NX34_GOSAR|nr:Endonuclease V [Gossypium arboreum]
MRGSQGQRTGSGRIGLCDVHSPLSVDLRLSAETNRFGLQRTTISAVGSLLYSDFNEADGTRGTFARYGVRGTSVAAGGYGGWGCCLVVARLLLGLGSSLGPDKLIWLVV